MKEVRLKARAKINISLDVIGKREDGYHNISTIMQSVDLYDKVNIRVANKKNKPIEIKTNLNFLPVDEKNLVYQVIKYIKTSYNINKSIFVDLYKVIPIAAGLGGGSSDAGAAIKAMNILFDLKLSTEEMINIGKRFGADIPFFMLEGTVLAEGIGDIMTRLQPFPQCNIVLVKPNVGISTASIFNNLKLNQIQKRPNTKLLIDAINNQDLITITNNLCNVLEEVTIQECPEISKIKKLLKQEGALGALMSGSGSAVFGIFEDEDKAFSTTQLLKQQEYVKFAYSTTIYNRRD